MFRGVLNIQMFTICYRDNLSEFNQQSKNVLLATRVTPHISNIVKMMANREGLYVSEWIRALIVNELKKNKAFLYQINPP